MLCQRLEFLSAVWTIFIIGRPRSDALQMKTMATSQLSRCL